jgi:hypothetical protein
MLGVGIGLTETLANRLSKKYPDFKALGVCNLQGLAPWNQTRYFAEIEVEDVWGVVPTLGHPGCGEQRDGEGHTAIRRRGDAAALAHEAGPGNAGLYDELVAVGDDRSVAHAMSLYQGMIPIQAPCSGAASLV